MTGIPVSLSPAAIERELTAMWDQRGGEDEPGGVAHFSLGNVVWLGSSRHVARTRRIFSELVSKFPCRLFLLEYAPDMGGERIESFANAYCFASKGRESEVCCEEITMRFGEGALRHVPGAVLPLLLADVPTFLWYSSADPEHYGAMLQALVRAADRVITEVAHMPDPAAGLAKMADARSKTISMSWYRSFPMRDNVASLFDDPRCLALLPAIDRVRVQWAGTDCDVQALTNACMLVGWFASKAGWRATPGAPQPFTGAAGPVAVDMASLPAARDADCGQIVRFEARTSAGDCLSLATTEAVGRMERIVAGPCGTCRDTPRFVHARTWSEVEALGFAFNSSYRHGIFQRAAAMAAPLLARALEKK